MDVCTSNDQIMQTYVAFNSPLLSKSLAAGIKQGSSEIKCYFDVLQCRNDGYYCTILMWDSERVFIPANSERGKQLLDTMGPEFAVLIRDWDAMDGTSRNAEPVTPPDLPSAFQPDLPGGPQRGRAAGAPIAGSDR